MCQLSEVILNLIVKYKKIIIVISKIKLENITYNHVQKCVFELAIDLSLYSVDNNHISSWFLSNFVIIW